MKCIYSLICYDITNRINCSIISVIECNCCLSNTNCFQICIAIIVIYKIVTRIRRNYTYNTTVTGFPMITSISSTRFNSPRITHIFRLCACPCSHRIHRKMLRLKGNCVHRLFRRNFYDFADRFNAEHVFSFDLFFLNCGFLFCLLISILNSLYMKYFYCRCLLAGFLHRIAGECNLYALASAPDFRIQKLIVQPEVDIIGINRGKVLSFRARRLYNRSLYFLAYTLSRSFHASRKHSCLCLDGDLHSVIHDKRLFKLRMLSRLRHHHVDALLFHYAVHRVPCGLGAVFVVCDSVSGQFLAVCQHGFHCVAHLVLHAEVQVFAVFHATGAVHDSRGSFGSDGVFHLPAFHVVQGVQLVQSRCVKLRRSAPADSNDIAVTGLRRLLDLRIRGVGSLRLCGCGICLGNGFFRSCGLCRCRLLGSCGLLCGS